MSSPNNEEVNNASLPRKVSRPSSAHPVDIFKGIESPYLPNSHRQSPSPLTHRPRPGSTLSKERPDIPHTSRPDRSVSTKHRHLRKVNPQAEQINVEPNFFETSRPLTNRSFIETERLHEDNFNLKSGINQLTEENLRLKSQIKKLERENAKLAKDLEFIGTKEGAEFHAAKASESSLVATFKRQVKEIRETLMKKEEELENLKRSVKITKIQELETEIKAYHDENTRLVEIISKLHNEKQQIDTEEKARMEEKYYVQNTLIEILQKDNTRLVTRVKQLEKQCYEMQQESEREAVNYQKKNSELHRLRQHLREKERIANLKIIENKKLPKSPIDKEGKASENDIVKILAEKDAEIERLEKQVNSLENEIRVKRVRSPSIANTEDLEINYQTLGSQRNEIKLTHQNYKRFLKKTPERRRDSGQRLNSHDFKSPIVTRLKFDDVKDLGYELTLKLRLRKVTYDQAEAALITPNLEEKGQATIEEIKHQLTAEPFTVYEENEALLMARFLVESSTQAEIFIFDPSRSGEVNLIKQAFKKLLGNYHIVDPQTEKSMIADIGNTVKTHEKALSSQFTSAKEARKGFLPATFIVNCFKTIEPKMSTAQLDYLIMRLYDFTGNLAKLDFAKVFEIFELPLQEIEEEIDKIQVQPQSV